ncbi:hypothetical protein [Pseudochryseolinea flava]|uniref:Uncharacterized protein n=1 Tax=Pseudochryseolinea flava TaxID=2059302 RepID=A0A364Y4E4_9BACT|nr:hypothetical protein [Pseudochryseolinea flava]RAW01812.1 hypothetical protein DQQ10_09210 [Pseudochryseolinea flava]
MAFFDKLLGKKKPELKAKCPITREPIENGFGYLLTTSQIVASKKYWDMIMTEPETMSYTVSHFKNISSGTQMRNMIFEKYSTIDKPWMISDSCINLFENVDKKEARENARKWWANAGNFTPESSGPAVQTVDNQTFQNWKDYAVMEAGRNRIVLQ